MSVRSVLILVLLGQLATVWLQCHAHEAVHPPGTRAHIHLDWFHGPGEEDHDDGDEHSDDGVLTLPDEHTGPMVGMLGYPDGGRWVLLPPVAGEVVASRPEGIASLAPTVPRRLRI
jgi:hypothetical protein